MEEQFRNEKFLFILKCTTECPLWIDGHSVCALPAATLCVLTLCGLFYIQLYILGAMHLLRLQGGGPKIRPKCKRSKGGCVNLVPYISPDCEQGRGKRDQNPENFANVIKGCPLNKPWVFYKTITTLLLCYSCKNCAYIDICL